MQFVTNGPDIPDALLQAHEEGRVVFFCGAGISYPAGLPGFKGLVEEIYRLNGTTPSDSEREAFERGQFDATLDLLERRLSKTILSGGCCGPCRINRDYLQNTSPTSTLPRRWIGCWMLSRMSAFDTAI